jgi:glycerate dehydrogenase
VAELIGDSDGVLLSKVRITDEILAKCPNLKYIGLTATGYNNVDTEACKRRGIVVTNIPAYSSDAVCQMTLSYILQFSTSLVAYDASTRRGDWKCSELFCYAPYPQTELRGKTLGLFGLGEIGSKVAKVADALGMRVKYHCRTPKDVPYEFVSLETLFSESDYLSLHAPLTPETERVVNAETLSRMKKSAFLINTARGGLVDEQALRAALDSGHLLGAGIDVLQTEPMTADCPLYGAPNCIITPHIAWAGLETRHRLMGVVADDLRHYLAGDAINRV